MTLITAFATADWVALAADRRLTWTGPNGEVRRKTDADTKIAVIDGELLVGYAGAVPATEAGAFGSWIGDLMRTLTEGPTIPFLRSSLTEHWASTPSLTGQRFVLVTVGFTSDAFGRPVEAQMAVISNSMDADGRFSPYSKVSDTFEVRTWSPSDGYLTMTQGYLVDERDLREAFALDESCARLDSVTADRVSDDIFKLHQTVADESTGSVGSATLIVFMSRSAFRSTVVSTYLGGGLVVSHGGSSRNEPDSGGPVDYEQEIVAKFADPAGVVTDKYPPSQVPSGRALSQTSITIEAVRIGSGDVFFPPLRPLTDENPGF